MNPQTSYVLITGGSSGIGYELAKLFAADHYNVILVARSGSVLAQAQQQLQQQYNIEVITIVKDLFDPESPFQLYEEVVAKGLDVTVLVNNAGQGEYGEFKDTSIARELSIIQLNIASLVALTKLFLVDMLHRGEGKILNLSSIAAKSPGPWQSVYHGTKAFVQSFTEAIREELKETGVTVTALLPGATATDFFNKADMLDAKPVAEGSLADPAKVARDGYEALMKGDDMIVSGFKNKVTVGLGSVLPDSTQAAQMYKQQAPVDKK